ncbi:hypothetical protein Poli38472_003256 [Pythium oligandrum]|uniref:GPI-anchored wall transfer protein n=1 Tax=Pythium oligandrum TaxID=41045 RepID=A0A8K1FCL7_PYTOL|nr:hypothetical protein Poli38472_003256 [Pythium oligandrum]|eukprot:TMW57331.1 hypothetical protein Poli38472_003256 [Pythium oligandrum]
MQDDEYKRAKEAFVADLSGTTGREVFAIFAVMPGTQWLYSELLLLLEVAGLRTVGAGHFAVPVTLLLEFVVLTLPTMIVFTYAEYTLPILATVYFSAAVLNRLSWKHAREYVHKYCRKEKMNQVLDKELPFLTSFRAQLMISTCFAILAVDFPIFPRRFAKTETYGFSVMDVGVGAFILSSGIVSSYARNARPSTTQQRSRGGGQHKSLLGRVYAFFRPILPVLVLGVARFLTVKGVNYQEHVSEYGVHWNFYFTLAGVYLLFSVFELFGSWATSPVLAGFLSVGYQVYLSQYGGEDFILNAPRDTIFSQNREGILSLIGYTALYISSVYAGQVVFSRMDSNGGKTLRNFRWLVIWFGLAVVLLTLGTFVVTRLVARPSRRMMNLSYILWVLAESAFLLFAYCGIYAVSLLPRTPLLFQGVSRNQLFIFLISNIATGIVNLSMQTIYASNLTAAGVLVTYMLAVSTVATLLETYNVRIKL